MSGFITNGELRIEAERLCDENERLQAENAKLRKKADMLQWNSDCFIKIYGSWKRLRATVPHLERENAKLRELVSELWVSCPVHDSDCDECKHKGGRTGCELYDRMLELGVTA